MRLKLSMKILNIEHHPKYKTVLDISWIILVYSYKNVIKIEAEVSN